MNIEDIIKNKILSKNKKLITKESFELYDHGKGFVTFIKRTMGEVTYVTYRLESDYSFWKCIFTSKDANEYHRRNGEKTQNIKNNNVPKI